MKNLRKLLEDLESEIIEGGALGVTCDVCGGAEPGSIGGIVLFYGRDTLEKCEGCGAALVGGKPLAQRVTVSWIHLKKDD